MKVRVDGLSENVTLEILQEEFRKIAHCSVSLQNGIGTVEFLDIVHVKNAIKQMNGKELLGKPISVSMMEQAISLGRKRSRSRSPPGGSTISLSSKPSDAQATVISLPGGKKTTPAMPDQTIQLNKRPSQEVPVKKAETAPPVVTESKATEENKVPEKTNQTPAEESKNPSNDEPQPLHDEDDMVFIYEDGSQFMTIDEDKVHCIACDRQITKKTIKKHCDTKAHKNKL